MNIFNIWLKYHHYTALWTLGSKSDLISPNYDFSQGLRISINYKPVCVAPTIQKKDNGIDLICTVDSKPQSTTYRWLFNSSETTFEIPSAESTMFFR